MDNFVENNDFALFIDILADMICHYLQAGDTVNYTTQSSEAA